MVDTLDHTKLLTSPDTDDDQIVCNQIAKARRAQQTRLHSPERLNSDMTNAEIRQKSGITTTAISVLNTAAQTLELSARGYMRTIRVARTIADLDESKTVLPHHVYEALQYRNNTASHAKT